MIRMNIRDMEIRPCIACHGCTSVTGYKTFVLYLCMQVLPDWAEEKSGCHADLHRLQAGGRGL